MIAIENVDTVKQFLQVGIEILTFLNQGLDENCCDDFFPLASSPFDFPISPRTRIYYT